MVVEFDTYPKYLLHHYQRWPSRVSIRRKLFGLWQEYSWKDCYDITKSLSLGLISLGLEPGDTVCIIGDEEPEGFLAIGAVYAARGKVVGIWSDSLPSEVRYVALHSDATFAVVEDQEQVDKMLEIKDQLPKLKKVVYWDPKGLRSYDDPILISYEEVRRLGTEYEERHPGIFEENVAKGASGDIAFLGYTSGTTGIPKGAMITHRSIMASARGWLKIASLTEKDDIFSLIQAGNVFHEWIAGMHYISGAPLHFPEEPETAADDYREISPRMLNLAPRQWESLISMVQVKIGDAGPLKRLAYSLFLPVGYRMADLYIRNQRSSLFWKVLYALGNLAVFRPIRDHLGLVNTTYPCTGGSSTGPDFFRFYYAVGVKLLQTYGSQEAGFDAGHWLEDIDPDTIGQPAPGSTIRISEEGEVLWKGDTLFSGYYKDAEKTAVALREGWYHSGDAGMVNEQGHFVFLSRLVEMGQLRNGHRYAPQYIEDRLKFSPYIKDAMVVGGEKRDYVSAIINIDFENVGKWAENHRIPYTTFVDLSQREEAAVLVKKDIERVNRLLPEASRLRRYVLMHKEFDPDEAELTRTRKLRRGFMEERYRNLIEAMYGGEKEVPVEAQVTYRDGRTSKVSTSLKVRTVEEGVS